MLSTLIVVLVALIVYDKFVKKAVGNFEVENN